jgi:hypothetical protein
MSISFRTKRHQHKKVLDTWRTGRLDTCREFRLNKDGKSHDSGGSGGQMGPDGAPQWGARGRNGDHTVLGGTYRRIAAVAAIRYCRGLENIRNCLLRLGNFSSTLFSMKRTAL